MKNSLRGFAPLVILLVVAIVGAVGAGVYFYNDRETGTTQMSGNDKPIEKSDDTPAPGKSKNSQAEPAVTKTTGSSPNPPQVTVTSKSLISANAPVTSKAPTQLGATVKKDHVSINLPEGWKAITNLDQIIGGSEAKFNGVIAIKWTKGDFTLSELTQRKLNELTKSGAQIRTQGAVRVGNKAGYYVESIIHLNGKNYRQRLFVIAEGIYMYSIEFATLEEDFEDYKIILQKSVNSIIIDVPNSDDVKYYPSYI